LSHVKVVYEPGRPIEAKAYFGLVHTWLRPGLDPDEPNQPVPLRGRRTNGVASSISQATEFLLASRTRAGWWRDFSGTGREAHEDWSRVFGWTDEWLSAFVATALAGTGDARARQAAQQTWMLLAERRLPSGGWGHNRMAPVDGDSTAFGLRLARVIGAVESAAARAARLILERHRLPDGGIASYLEADCPRLPTESLRPPDGSYAGWCRTSHACVTANTASLGDARALEFLRRAQREDGSWASYWWDEDGYATALAAEALAATGRADDRARIGRAACWAATRIGPDGGVADAPFATARALGVLHLAADGTALRQQRERSVRWLIDRQDADGGWPASAWSLAPRPDVTDRKTSPVPPIGCLDEARTFTTAAVLAALTGSAA
jgi:squalene cyclase